MIVQTHSTREVLAMDSPPSALKIKKYPNRRFYDTSRSRHVTLDDLYALVRGGQSIQVTDSQTGADITSHVLAQMILERDAPKMDLFPAGLLHQVIQTNQNILQSFMERYFTRAFDAFLQSQHQFEGFLRRAGVPEPNMTSPMQWARQWLTGLSPQPPQNAPDGREDARQAAEPSPPDAGAIDDLRNQLADVSRQLSELRAQSQPKRRRPARKRRADGKPER